MAARRTSPPMADINLTPFIDVLLVLLILFMVAVPAAQRGLDVAAPETAKPASTPTPPPVTPPVLEIHSAEFVLGRERFSSLESLQTGLQSAFAGRSASALIVKSDRDVEYGRVIAALDVARGAGVTRFGVITSDPPVAAP